MIRTGLCPCVTGLHSGTLGSGVAIVRVCVCVSGVWDNGGSGAGPESDCVWTCGAGDLSL